ncbi:hypothetical protein Ait01nite_031080 [Actinoplanes italicus]|nr:hypothetical protein Ait01nite_031080 [Actinoplanes italicus]
MVEKDGTPCTASDTTEPPDRASAPTIAQGWAWAIRWGADNIAANARLAIAAANGTVIRSEGGFLHFSGPNGEVSTFITQLVADGPLSFYVLSIADLDYARAVSLKDTIHADLKNRLGIPA